MIKPTKWPIRPVWSESSLSAWKNIGPLTTHWVHNEDSDQTGRMPRLIWVFAGRTCHFVGFVVWRLIWSQDVLVCLSLGDLDFIDLDFLKDIVIFSGERIIQHRSENLGCEILVNPQTQTVNLAVKNFLSTSTKYKHLIYAGHAFQVLNFIPYHKSIALKNIIWATSCQNVSLGIFEQVRFKPACSATQVS